MKLSPTLTGLIYGVSGSGKSTLLAELAKTIFKEDRLRTFVFLADEGSRLPYDILRELGVVTIAEPTGNPWIWINRAFQGLVRTEKGWEPVTNLVPDLGLIIHDGLTSYAELMMQEMARMSAENVNVGGDGIAVVGKDKEKDEKNALRSWKIEVKGDGKDSLKIGGNSQAHYGLAQVQIREGLLAAHPPVPHFYTATLRRGAEEGTKAPVVGPQIVGGALTGSLPRWLDYTFHSEIVGAEHVLYVMAHPDTAAGGRTMALANPRLPQEGAKVKVQSEIKPASLVVALRQIAARRAAAFDEVKLELGL